VKLAATFVCVNLDSVLSFLLTGSDGSLEAWSHAEQNWFRHFHGVGARSRRQKDFFIWILCNPLKRLDSAKGIQGNASFFPWISLDLLALICG
jgi:hypothetical protein